MPCIKGCCVEKIEVTDEGDAWLIKRRSDYKRLTEYTQGEPEYPDIKITPGQDPEDENHIVPVEIVYPKKYGDLTTIVEEIVPGIAKKEEKCSVCKETMRLLQAIRDKRQ